MPRKKHILLVEDDADVRAQIGVVIELLGYEVHMAGDVDEAKSRFHEHQVDLVISDLWLPGGNGNDLLHEFKRDRADLPVIILTGFPTQETIRQTLVEEGFAYVAKPVQGQQLKQLIERALGEQSSSHKLQT